MEEHEPADRVRIGLPGSVRVALGTDSVTNLVEQSDPAGAGGGSVRRADWTRRRAGATIRGR
jgi:hypothetical protein